MVNLSDAGREFYQVFSLVTALFLLLYAYAILRIRQLR